MMMEHLLLRIVNIDLIIDYVFLSWMISMSFHTLTTTASNNLLFMKGVFRALILSRLSHHSRRL